MERVKGIFCARKSLKDLGLVESARPASLCKPFIDKFVKLT